MQFRSQARLRPRRSYPTRSIKKQRVQSMRCPSRDPRPPGGATVAGPRPRSRRRTSSQPAGTHSRSFSARARVLGTAVATGARAERTAGPRRTSACVDQRPPPAAAAKGVCVRRAQARRPGEGRPRGRAGRRVRTFGQDAAFVRADSGSSAPRSADFGGRSFIQGFAARRSRARLLRGGGPTFGGPRAG